MTDLVLDCCEETCCLRLKDQSATTAVFKYRCGCLIGLIGRVYFILLIGGKWKDFIMFKGISLIWLL